MACEPVTLRGIPKECETNIGGIRRAYIALFDNVEVTPNQAGEEIASITMASGAKFKSFEFRRNSSNLTSTLNVSDSGAKYWTSELTMLFSRMETIKRIAINSLVAAEACVIVEDANGKVWFLGKDEPVMASAGSGETGTARDDANQYSITLQDVSKEAPYEINNTYWETNKDSLVDAEN